MSADDRYLQAAATHFSLVFNESGETGRGVDWSSDASQQSRFAPLCTVIDAEGACSINDLGCGYGALVEHLARTRGAFTYHGCDVSATMIAAARARYAGQAHLCFSIAAHFDQPADYTLASGILHKRFGRSDAEMAEYVLRTLTMMDRASVRGFAFNAFSLHADARNRRDDLYYADPCALVAHCLRCYSPRIALLHDAEPLDFTIVVRKSSPLGAGGAPNASSPSAQVGDR